MNHSIIDHIIAEAMRVILGSIPAYERTFVRSSLTRAFSLRAFFLGAFFFSGLDLPSLFHVAVVRKKNKQANRQRLLPVFFKTIPCHMFSPAPGGRTGGDILRAQSGRIKVLLYR